MSSFLLVSLNIDAILDEITLHQRKKKLDEMTKGEGLGDAYAATLSRMKAQPRSRSKLGMEVLMWVSHAMRPLRVDELCHALGVEEGSADLNTRNIPAIETLLTCCLGLVTVEKSSFTIRLVHYTLQEYLCYNPSLFLNPHSNIAKVCLSYLNFPYVRGFSPALRSVPPTAAFVEYASCYWGSHARRETTECVKTLALKLLHRYDEHISSKILLLRRVRQEGRPFDTKDTPAGFTGLHGAAYFGCVEITIGLLETNGWDAQATDFHGNTVIAWAVGRGHEGVVRVLLEQSNANPNTADTISGRTPLTWAAKNGHEGVVRILLERDDVDCEKPDKWSRTPLLRAAENGHEGVVRILLERDDVDYEKPDKWSRTPLLLAAENGHEGAVRMLLKKSDVNPETANMWNETPLSRAARNGHEGVVRILLEQNDINPDTADTKYGHTPLSWAARYGHEGIVRLLLERGDVDLDKADKWSQTPLLWTAVNGHEGVMRILLERGDINPDTADTEDGQTPLSWAAENGHVGIVKMLLERNDVNPDKADNWGRTPLSRAAKNGHEGAVRMLLERHNIITNTTDSVHDQTLFLCATTDGHESLMKGLLEQNDGSPNTADPNPEAMHEGIPKLLQERADLVPECAASL